MTDRFAEFKAEIENKNTLEPEQAGTQWEDGDPCGEEDGTCGRPTHRREFGRPKTAKPHKDAPEAEAHCPIHGIVGSER